MLPAPAARFRDDLLDRLAHVRGVHADGVTADCPICGQHTLAVVFAGCDAAAEIVCVDGCPDAHIRAAIRARRR